MEREILIRGRLMNVNGEKRTAELHNFGDTLIALQFEESLCETMQKLATCFVKILGIEQAGPSNQFGPLKVREASVAWPTVEEFEAVEPKIFDPERAKATALPADDPLDIEEFIRVIYEARDA